MKDLKVIFMGTPVFCVPILEELIKETNVLAVVTQPDKEVGRKKLIEYSAVKKEALALNIPVFQPINIRKEYEYIINNYVPNEVILASELKACGKSDAAIRRELKKLTEILKKHNIYSTFHMDIY